MLLEHIGSQCLAPRYQKLRITSGCVVQCLDFPTSQSSTMCSELIKAFQSCHDLFEHVWLRGS